MLQFKTVTCLNEEDMMLLKTLLNTSGYALYEINGKEIRDEKSFFREIIRNLPQDPPLSGKVNYDAFLDSVSGGIYDREEEKVAFLWTDVNNILESGLQDLLKIACYFYYVQERLTRHNYELLVFLVGKGDNFCNIETEI